MRAAFSGIEIGRTGLTIAQLGLDVTGHNVANVETAGYTRQRLVQTAYDPFATIGKALPVSQALVGGGVRVKILDQIRSAYLDRRFRTENTINAYWLKRTEGLTYLESYFDDANEETSINFSVAKFFEAIKELAKDPVEGAPRKLLQTAGMDLVQQLNTIYEGLIDLQSSQNLAVKVTVEEINRMAAEIVDLNKSIYAFEVTGHLANDLLDKRNLLLDEMSALVDIEYREEPDGKGGVKLIVEIGGRTLLDHDRINRLDVEERDNPIPGEEDVYVPIWEAAKIPGMDPILDQYVPFFTGLNGTYARLTQLYDPDTLTPIDMQDLDAVQAAMERINEITSRFARITPRWEDCQRYIALAPAAAAGLLTTEEQEEWGALIVTLEEPLALFNELNAIVGGGAAVFEMKEPPPDWDWCVHTGISIGGADIVYACNDTYHSQIERARVRLEPGQMILESEDLVVKGGELRAYLDMRDSRDAHTPGIPYYVDMLNNLARALVQEINEVHRQGWTDAASGSVTGVNFFEEFGNLSLITAKNISLSAEVKASEFNIACSTKQIVNQGAPDELQRGNNENMNALYELFLKKNISINVVIDGVPGTVDIGSFDSYVTGIRFDVANTLSYAKKTAVNSTTLLIAAENQRVSVSGVSLDEEMINMVKYQHAYSGASRIITAMDEMLDRLINSTGRVGL